MQRLANALESKSLLEEKVPELQEIKLLKDEIKRFRSQADRLQTALDEQRQATMLRQIASAYLIKSHRYVTGASEVKYVFKPKETAREAKERGDDAERRYAEVLTFQTRSRLPTDPRELYREMRPLLSLGAQAAHRDTLPGLDGKELPSDSVHVDVVRRAVAAVSDTLSTEKAIALRLCDALDLLVVHFPGEPVLQTYRPKP